MGQMKDIAIPMMIQMLLILVTYPFVNYLIASAQKMAHKFLEILNQSTHPK
jgi:hypothetical protein